LVLQAILSEGYLDFCTISTEKIRDRIRCIKFIKGPKTDFDLLYRNPLQITDRKSGTPTPPCTVYSVRSAHNTNPEYAASVAALSFLETYTDIKDDSPSLDPRYDSTIPLHGSGDNAFQADALERLNHSPIGNTRVRATSSHWSLGATSVASYKETVRDILKRGSRTSSCISEIVSLLGRFSLHQSKSSLCDSTHRGSVHKRSSLAETISHRRLLTPSSATVVEDHSLSGQTISRHRVLEHHIETVQKHNTALLSTCRGRSQSQDCVHRRIIQATLFGSSPQPIFFLYSQLSGRTATTRKRIAMGTTCSSLLLV